MRIFLKKYLKLRKTFKSSLKHLSNTDKYVKKVENILMLKWHKIGLMNLNYKIMNGTIMYWYSIKHLKEKNVKQLILNSMENLINNGMKTSNRIRILIIKCWLRWQRDIRESLI